MIDKEENGGFGKFEEIIIDDDDLALKAKNLQDKLIAQKQDTMNQEKEKRNQSLQDYKKQHEGDKIENREDRIKKGMAMLGMEGKKDKQDDVM